MTLTAALQNSAEHLDAHLNLERQIWLLGAGASFNSRIPLMYPLTKRVEDILTHPADIIAEDTTQSSAILGAIRQQMSDKSHIEHYMSQIGDLISLAERKVEKTVVFGNHTFSAAQLRDAHRHVQVAIRYTIEFGYSPGNANNPAQIGSHNKPIVTRAHHEQFIKSLFLVRRAGMERHSPVRFFTTNYDTLLEDALAHCAIPFLDGFTGGATGFWDPRNINLRTNLLEKHSLHSAIVYKLHGSIDWISTDSDIVMRVRTPMHYNLNIEHSRLLIYPQATKYQVTQRDPFATLFSEFRHHLACSSPTVLIVCGYSFGDEHINEEIERALRNTKNSLTLVACCLQNSEGTEGLPSILAEWLASNEDWISRIIVVGSKGYYKGSLKNQIPCGKPVALGWWTFEGISRFLADGPETLK